VSSVIVTHGVQIDADGGLAAIDDPSGSMAWVSKTGAFELPVLAFWVVFAGRLVLSWRRAWALADRPGGGPVTLADLGRIGSHVRSRTSPRAQDTRRQSSPVWGQCRRSADPPGSIWPPPAAHPLFSRAGFHGLSDQMPRRVSAGKEPHDHGDSDP
jgi:hypothetical protein